MLHQNGSPGLGKPAFTDSYHGKIRYQRMYLCTKQLVNVHSRTNVTCTIVGANSVAPAAVTVRSRVQAEMEDAVGNQKCLPSI